MSNSLAETLTYVVREGNAITYNTLAAFTFLFWDHCLTFGDEARAPVELVWKAKWRFVSYVFILIRYLSLVMRFMQIMFYAGLFDVLHPNPVEMLLILRVYAFYGEPKNLLIALYVLFVAMHGTALVYLAVILSKFIIIPNPFFLEISTGTVCISTKIPKQFPDHWIFGLVYESLLFLLLIGMFIQKRFAMGMEGGRLLEVFVRDGGWAFLTVFVILLWCVIEFTNNTQSTMGAIGVQWFQASLGVVGSRLVLNLRAAGRKRITLMPELVQMHTFNVETSFPSSSSLPVIQQQDLTTTSVSEGVEKGSPI
ncbi:hypothetical protein BU17DRAFT_86410 [Hysterangium stoloniferum]|nr:hypothetical protein BU17DRAFT_86410 [Hysterangium stoloniferum]